VGEPQKTSTTANGVGDRKLTEATFRAVFERLPDAVLVVDRYDRIILSNGRVEELTGYSGKELQGQSVHVLVPDRYREGHIERVRSYTAAPYTRVLGAGLELSGRRKDGSGFPVEIGLSPLESKQGLLIVVVLREVSDRSMGLERMRYLARGVESAGEAILMTGVDGTIQYVNPAFTKMTGYTAEEAIGKTPRLLKSGRHTRAFYDQLWNTIRGGAVWSGELINRRKDGTLFMVTMTIAPVLSPSGVTEGFVAVHDDVTERRRSKTELERRARELELINAELEQFAYVASHDLQEPLRKIQAFGSKLVSQYAAVVDERGHDYIMRMQSAASRMQRLIGDLLAFSRVAWRTPLQSTKVDLNAVVNDAIANLSERVDQTGARFEIGKLPTVDANPVQMGQLLQNLIGNSLKYRHPDRAPVICISAHLADAVKEPPGSARRHWEIRIADNGIGFEPQYAEKIFEVFQRLHGRDEYEGTGIGLAICRKIIQKHGGTISACSLPGEGSTFTVTLPVEPSAL